MPHLICAIREMIEKVLKMSPIVCSFSRALGTELPSCADFERLGIAMGASRETDGSYSQKGYLPQLLPNLTYQENGRTYGHWFWSSSVHPRNSGSYCYFHGDSGDINYYTENTEDIQDYRGNHTVRCVFRRR